MQLLTWIFVFPPHFDFVTIPATGDRKDCGAAVPIRSWPQADSEEIVLFDISQRRLQDSEQRLDRLNKHLTSLTEPIGGDEDLAPRREWLELKGRGS
jgi:hypothetical protein